MLWGSTQVSRRTKKTGMPREKGSDGPPERPTSSDDPSTQVWEETPTRERKKISSERELSDEGLEQDPSNFSDELRAFNRIHIIHSDNWLKAMSRALEPYMQLPEYDGSGNPKTHWFRCISIWETRSTSDEKRQINEFGARLNGDALDWFIKVRKNINSLDELERQFIARFQHLERDEIAISQFRTVKQLLGETVFDYDKKFKTLMNQLDIALPA